MPISRAEFEGYFPQLVDDLIGHTANYGLPEQARTWFRDVLAPLLQLL